MELSERMNDYVKVTDHKLMKKQPAILWIDGKAFHTFCRGLNKPFDEVLIKTMQETAIKLCENIQGAKLAYVQSDEISIVLTDWEQYTTDAWFNYRIQKLASVTASMATLYFNNIWLDKCGGALCSGNDKDFEIYFPKRHRNATFDCKAFNLPNHEVENWLLFRQNDWCRNSIQMYARSEFSQKQLHKKNRVAMSKMLLDVGKDWEELDSYLKYGSVIIKEDCWNLMEETPLFKDNREFIKKVCDL